MTYAELVHALEAEVGRASDEMKAAAERDAAALVARARERAAEVRREAIAQAQAREETAAAGARARAALTEERETLLVQRRLLAEVENAALERLAAVEDPLTLARLKHEVLAETGSAAIEWRGAEAVVDGCVVLDNRLGSRLEKAWPQLEGEVSAILFGEPDDAL